MARVVVPGVPHHVTQRGNRGEDVFFSDAGRYRYLNLLAQYSAMHGLDILAYCLMGNHVHLVATPRDPLSIATTLKPVHLRYTQYVNRTEGLSGILWQGRPFSCPLDNRHFWAAVRYVERNPVRAGLTTRAEAYPWSSAAAHCLLRSNPILAPLPPHPDIYNWSRWLEEPDDDRLTKVLRCFTRAGLPLGDDAFIAQLESSFHRPLRPQPRGPKIIRDAT
jgi:putative transposase